MGKFIEIQETRKVLNEKNKFRKETLGKFFYDLAELSFAGLAIGWIMQITKAVWIMLSSYYLEFRLLLYLVLLVIKF